MFRLILVLALATLACARAPYVRVSTPRLGGRIVGGVATEVEEHPYQVSLQLGGSHLCGGSLIATNVVLTAAQCTEGLGSLIRYMSVRAGTTYHSGGGTVLKVTSIHEHSKFKRSNSYDYDASVLILSGSFKLSDSINIISLQDVGVEVPDQNLATVTGWGALKVGGSAPVITLHAVDVPKLNQTTCQNNYPREKISDRMHCFGHQEGGGDSCSGDSGGPLVVDGKLAGIVSWGYGCAFARFPGVYVKIANQEINEYVQGVLAKHI